MNNPQSTLPTIVRGDFGAARVSYLRSVGQRNDATAWARVAECELALGDAASALVSVTNDADASLVLARLHRARARLRDMLTEAPRPLADPSHA